MSRPRKDDFKWRQYQGKLILLCVRWYLAFTLSYRPLEQMLREQGWSVDHTSIFRWVQHYGPELAKRCRAFLKPTNRSCRTDETYIKLKGKIVISIKRSILPGRPLIFYSRQSATKPPPNLSFAEP